MEQEKAIQAHRTSVIAGIAALREIKFKYYCKEVTGKVFSFITTIEDLEQAKLNINTYGRIQEIIARCEYTGEMDSKRTPEFPKGQEIWEGDTVKASIYKDEEPQILPVYFDKGAFWIDYEDSESDRVPVGCFVGSLEVIGNIHDNETSNQGSVGGQG